MTLRIHTANHWIRDPDAFDVTRGSGGAAGAPFAPSREILDPVLDVREQVKALLKQAKRTKTTVRRPWR
jgi:hypothetical protein